MNKKQILLILSFSGIVLLLGRAALAAFKYAAEIQSGVGLLSLNPETVSAGFGESVLISLQFEYAEDAYGVDIPITFNPAILQVVDADTGASGVQILPGICPQPDHFLANSLDNATGTINYVAISLAPTAGCNGGEVALIEFVCVGLGTTVVSLNDALVSDSNLGSLTLTKQNATVTCANFTSTPGPTATATLRPPTPTPTATSTPTATPQITNNYLPLIMKQLTK